MDDPLYSPNLERRLEATLAVGERELQERWPDGCRGAANAFLVLLGPSMGHAGVGQRNALGGAGRTCITPMKIGRDQMSFDWHDARRSRWIRLCSSMLGKKIERTGPLLEDVRIGSLTALMNLDWKNSADEKSIPQADLDTGFTEFIWPTLKRIKPRILCPLSKLVWKTIITQIKACPNEPFVSTTSLVDSKGKGRSLSPIVFQFPGVSFKTLLIKPHYHPSRTLSYEQIDLLGSACTAFLNEPRFL